jgi:hypothetical protein
MRNSLHETCRRVLLQKAGVTEFESEFFHHITRAVRVAGS